MLTQELEDQLALLERIVDGLDRLDETTRVTVVLHHLGELDQDQVAEVLGEPPDAGRPTALRGRRSALDLVPLDPACHSAATAIDVPPPSVARVVSYGRRPRARRQWLVTGGRPARAGRSSPAVAYVATEPDPSATRPGAARAVTPVENPVDLRLVGRRRAAPRPRHRCGSTTSRQLVETGVGVVYADSEGVVVARSPRTAPGCRLGTMDPDTPLVSQPRAGLVAWTEPDGGDLVVYDVTTDREAGRVDGLGGLAGRRLGPRAPLLPQRGERLEHRARPFVTGP